MKICPKCHASPLKIRTDRIEWYGGVRCDACGYMERLPESKEEAENEELI